MSNRCGSDGLCYRGWNSININITISLRFWFVLSTELERVIEIFQGEEKIMLLEDPWDSVRSCRPYLMTSSFSASTKVCDGFHSQNVGTIIVVFVMTVTLETIDVCSMLHWFYWLQNNWMALVRESLMITTTTVPNITWKHAPASIQNVSAQIHSTVIKMNGWLRCWSQRPFTDCPGVTGCCVWCGAGRIFAPCASTGSASASSQTSDVRGLPWWAAASLHDDALHPTHHQQVGDAFCT